MGGSGGFRFLWLLGGELDELEEDELDELEHVELQHVAYLLFPVIREFNGYVIEPSVLRKKCLCARTRGSARHPHLGGHRVPRGLGCGFCCLTADTMHVRVLSIHLARLSLIS